MFHGLFKNLDLHLAQAITVLERDIQRCSYPARCIQIVQLRHLQFRIKVQDRFLYGHARKRLAEIVFFALPGNHRITQNQLCHGTQQFLCCIHQVLVVCVRLVEFQHGEFRIVACGQAFVAEAAVDLVYLLETTNHQALEIQLRCNTQVQLHIQCIMMGGKRPGDCTSRNALHHRRLDFQEIALVKKVADKLYDARTNNKGIA